MNLRSKVPTVPTELSTKRPMFQNADEDICSPRAKRGRPEENIVQDNASSSSVTDNSAFLMVLTDLKEARAEILKLCEEKTALNSEINSLKAGSADLLSLSASISALQEENNSFKNSFVSLKSQIFNLKNINSNLEEDATKLRALNAGTKMENSSLIKRNSELKTESIKYKKRYQVLKTENSTLKLQNIALKNENGSLKMKNYTCSREKDVVRKSLTQYKIANVSLTIENEILKKGVEVLKSSPGPHESAIVNLKSLEGSDKKCPGMIIHVSYIFGNMEQLTRFNMRKNVRFAKLMSTYCERQQLMQDMMRFKYGNIVLEEHQTPEEVGMEEGGIIQVYDVIHEPDN